MTLNRVKEFTFKSNNDRDSINLLEFLKLDQSGEARDLQMSLRMRNLGMKYRCGTSLKIRLWRKYIYYSLYDLDFGPVDRLIRKFRKRAVLKYLSGRKDFVLLDAGCGRQATLGWNIRHKCKKYMGVDRDIPPVTISNLQFLKGTVEDVFPSLPPESVDVVTALALIEHLDNPQDFVKQCLRVLKPGGVLMLTTPPPVSEPVLELISKLKIINGDEIDEHKNYFNKKTLTQLLNKCEFRTVCAKPFLFGFNLLVVGEKPESR